MVTRLTILETQRLVLRRLTTEDAPFIFQLLNEPSFIRFIGDKGVRNLEDARNYILNGPVLSYERNGFGLYLVELRETETSIGICGLIKRDSLPDVDVGFAFLPRFWKKGYAVESAGAVLNFAREVLKLDRIVAITDIENEASGKVLEKLGMKLDKLIKLSDNSETVKLFVPK